MSSVKTQSRYDASRHMNYISTAPFNTVFFTYTTSMNASYQTIGDLAVVTGADSTNCPAGRILRANNKKLYPDAAGLDLTTYPNRTPLVGVFDYHSGLSGFIDPNNAVFALYNGDKPVDSIDGEAADGVNNHKGMSVYTGGTVTAVGNISSTSGSVSAATTVTAGTGLTVTSGGASVTGGLSVLTGDFTVSTGKVYVPGSGANATTGTATLTSGTNVTISTTAVRTASRIFLTKTSASGAAQGTPWVTGISNAVSFTIASTGGTDTSTVNWLIIN
jgi:hypothetical protein